MMGGLKRAADELRPGNHRLNAVVPTIAPRLISLLVASGMCLTIATCASRHKDDGVVLTSKDKDDEVVLIPPYSGPVLTLDSPPRPPDDAQEIDIIGTLTAPMPGCLVLKSDEGPWELTGRLPDELGLGDEVEVFGQVAPQDEGRCDAPVVHVQKIAILSSVSRQVG
jgi:hypothetical protein